jgi:hypothetical protein
MHRRLWPGLLCLALLFCWTAGGRSEDAAGAKHMLWKATAGKSIVYLFGTIHVGTADLYPLASVIEDSFKKSSVLVEEVAADDGPDSKTISNYVQQKGVYPFGDFLQNHLTDDTRTRLKQYVGANKLDANTIVHLKPWAVALLLMQTDTTSVGLDKEKGLDKHFLEEATRTRKPVMGLETGESQIKLFGELPAAMQEQLLLVTMLDSERERSQLGPMMTAWKTGDTDALFKLSYEEPLRLFPVLKPVLVKLYDERNDAMTQKIEAFLKTPKTYFVAVGAGHLVGERGIVGQLRAKNYKVEQL